MGLVPAMRVAADAAVRLNPNAVALVGDTSPAGSGRLRVRFMRASRDASQTWLKVPAAAAANAVPIVAAARQGHDAGTPAMRYPAPDVKTTSDESRALLSSAPMRSIDRGFAVPETDDPETETDDVSGPLPSSDEGVPSEEVENF